MKILVIDDDDNLGKFLRMRLISLGYDVEVMPDAMLGIQEAHRFKPDLILLDLMLPAGGGLSVLKQLKASTHTVCIPVLIVSGMWRDVYEGIGRELQEIGVEGYLQKPFREGELLSNIQRILELKRGAPV